MLFDQIESESEDEDPNTIVFDNSIQDPIKIGQHMDDSQTLTIEFDEEREFTGFYSVIPADVEQIQYDLIPNLGFIYANCTINKP